MVACAASVWNSRMRGIRASIPMAHSIKLILASASPRRSQLLSAAGLSFEVVESSVAEIRREGEPARDYAMRMATEKARAVSIRFPGAIVVGADTIVVCGDEILEKPASPNDARRMLRMLAARTHLVITAFAIARGGAVLEHEPVESRVTFRALSDGEIAEYLATGEPFDKAGAYGIQGLARGFIASVEGSRDNVMGLPTNSVIAALARCGIAAESS